MALRMLRYVVRATRNAMAGVLASVMDARRTEELMTTYKTYAEEVMEQGMAQGMAKGLVRSMLRVLDARGLSLDDGARQRILSCTDTEVLEGWLERALTAATLSDVFGEQPR